ncbi:MAG: hypothetical protein PHW77_05795 [Eubacteriales bacterium]|nr:hypothetical protein [Eubacteriales bacterium]
MTALYITAGILLILVLMLFLKISFRISWCGDLLIAFRVGFYKKEYRLFGQKAEPEEAEAIPPKHKKPGETKEEPVSLKQMLPIIKETLTELYVKTKKHIRLDRYIVKIAVATDDPAKTGILYGVVAGSASSLLRLAEGIGHKTKRRGEIYTEVIPDFIAEKPDIHIDIILSTRVWRGLSMVYSLTNGYNKYKKLKTKGA